MRIGILFSSGKDSVNTLWYYLEQGWDVRCLLSLLPENEDSFMFQNPNEKLLHRQAKMLGLPLLMRATPGEKEEELEDLKELLKDAKDQFGIEGVAVGALASDYQQERVSRICHFLDLRTFAPLWHKDQQQLLREMISAGFDIRMTRIAAQGLSQEWLGKRLTMQDVDALVALNAKFGVAIGGEGGEFETIALAGPIFEAPIQISFGKRMESECRGELERIEISG